jgi:hypothetical protein
MAKVYIVEGEHPFIPGTAISAHATLRLANLAAASLLNIMLEDSELAADATPDNWEEKLEELHDERGDDDCYVIVLELDIEEEH